VVVLLKRIINPLFFIVDNLRRGLSFDSLLGSFHLLGLARYSLNLGPYSRVVLKGHYST
jgi:hypothetical protein